MASPKVRADEIRKRDLRGFFRQEEGEKSQKYFVYFKILRQNHGGKVPQSAEAALDRRLLMGKLRAAVMRWFFPAGFLPPHPSSGLRETPDATSRVAIIDCSPLWLQTTR